MVEDEKSEEEKKKEDDLVDLFFQWLKESSKEKEKKVAEVL